MHLQICLNFALDYVQTLGRPVGSFYGHGLFQQFKRKDGQLYNVSALFLLLTFVDPDATICLYCY